MHLSGEAETIVSEKKVPATAEYLSAQELATAYESQSDDDKIKLMVIERKYLSGTGRQRGELFHEALYRVAIDERHCPRHLSVMAFLVQTMRSIADHDREKLANENFTPLENKEGVIKTDAETSAGLSGLGSLNPEGHLLRKEEEANVTDVIATIQSHFDGDDDCQLLILGWCDGLRGAELRNFLGVDQTRLDYLAKKFRRKMGKQYPNGWSQ